MRRIVAYLLIAAVASGCSPKILPTAEPETIETFRVEYRERIVHDTAWVDIPHLEQKISTPSQESHLETDYAVSDASVDSMGLLHHSLVVLPQRIAAPVDVPVSDTTSTLRHEEIITQTVYVDKPIAKVVKVFALFGIAALLLLVSVVVIKIISKK